MKRYFSFIAIAAFLAAACQPDDSQGGGISVSKESVILAAEDGSATFEITSAESWTATADETWVILNPSEGDGSDEPVTVTVTASADNTTAFVRTAEITVVSGNQKATVTVEQSGKAAGDDDGAVNANYKGKGMYCAAEDDALGGHAYSWIDISDKGWDIAHDPETGEEEAKMKADAYYYTLTFYNEVQISEGMTEVEIPSGAYRFSSDFQGNDGPDTFNIACKYKADAETSTQIIFTEGTAVVSEREIRFTCTAEDGTVHNVIYQGSLSVPIFVREEEPDSGEAPVPITEDVTLDATDGQFWITSEYSDDFELYKWSVAYYSETTEESITLELYTADDDIDKLIATFNPMEAGESNEYVLGSYFEGDFFGCYYFNSSGEVGFISSGSITISRNGEVYTMTFECADENEYKIAGSVSGTIAEE